MVNGVSNYLTVNGRNVGDSLKVVCPCLVNSGIGPA